MIKVGIWFLAVILAGCAAGPQVAEGNPRYAESGAAAAAAAAAAEGDASAGSGESSGTEMKAAAEQEPVQTVFRLAKELHYFGDGSLDRYTEYLYDSSGLLVREERYGEEDEPLETIAYRYDERHLAEKITYAGTEELKSTHRYTYTSEGFMESDSLFDAEDRIQISSRYAYDDQGARLRWEIFDSAGSLMARTEYLYENGRLVGIEIFTADGSLSDFSTVEYDEQERKVRESFYAVPKKLEKVAMFEYAGDVLDTESNFDATGNLIGRNMYQYDEEGLLVNTIFLDGGENVKEIVEREYAFIEID